MQLPGGQLPAVDLDGGCSIVKSSPVVSTKPLKA